jgi:tRNA-binding EMAP/Myf-like protein
MMGLESNGMILAAKTEDGGAVLLHPDKDVSAGSRLS